MSDVTATHATVGRLLAHEAAALLTRLRRADPMALRMPMVAAAAPSTLARQTIDRHLGARRLEVERAVKEFQVRVRTMPPIEAQQQLTALRLRFTGWLDQYDLFADALTQRSERDVGVWLAGLDAAATDALSLAGLRSAIPVLCYLDRGSGAAIRRVSTPLPGGGKNPVAVIRIPRERMVGGALPSSLVHEVGHQAAAALDLVGSLTPVVRSLQRSSSPDVRLAWSLWERWLSEVLADLWAVAKVGVAATLGLMGVMSLPRAFVFRISPNDPHPTPWIRVRLSCVLGQALYPDPQWASLSKVWSALYATDSLDADTRHTFAALEGSMSAFAALLLHHRPRSLRGLSLCEGFAPAGRHPSRLAAYYLAWDGDVERMRSAPPTLVFAVLGQARANDWLSPSHESALLVELLKSGPCAVRSVPRAAAGTRTRLRAGPQTSSRDFCKGEFP